MLICLWAGAFMAFGPFLSPTYAYMPLGWSINGLWAFVMSHVCLYAFGLKHQWPSGLCYVPYLLICLWAGACMAFEPSMCPYQALMSLDLSFWLSSLSTHMVWSLAFGLELMLAFEPF